MRSLVLTSVVAVATLSSLAPAKQGCTSACVPLMDLGGGIYLGYEGGLYPGGGNEPPPSHASAARRAAEAVVPRDANGIPHPDGLTGVLSIGVSNQLLEWRAVTRRLDADTTRAGDLVLVNGAAGSAFSTQLADPNSVHWTEFEGRVVAAGLTPLQVQVAFVETATRYDPPRPFPQHAIDLAGELREIVRNARARFPNLRLAYVSSVTYTGYSIYGVSEPLSYEQGFAVKWLIEAQMLGEPLLNHDPLLGPVEAPVVVWGPYLWAFGDMPRLDGFSTPRPYFGPDGVHASRLGEERIADQYLVFLAGSASAQTWLRPRPGRARLALPIDADTTLDAGQPHVAFGAAPDLVVDNGPRRALLRSNVAPLPGAVAHAKLCLEAGERSLNVHPVGVSNTTWDETTVTSATAPAFDGASSLAIPITSKGALAEWDVTQQVSLAAPNGAVSLGLVGTAIPLHSAFLARESVFPGWIALSIDEAPGGYVVHCPARPNSTGAPALLAVTGSTSLAADDLDLQVADAPPGVVMFPLLGLLATEVTRLGGELCVGGQLLRLPPVVAGPNGRATLDPTWNVQPGDARTIQLLFRDSMPGNFRTTSAVTLVFRP
jgi:hypothetical protein